MIQINFLDFNRATGLLGLLVLSIAVSLVFFSIAYFSEGAGWSGAAEDEEDEGYEEIAGNWYTGGVIALVLAGLLFAVSVTLLIINHIRVKKSREFNEPKRLLWNIFDLNRLPGLLALILIPTGTVFFTNGFIYKAEAWRWENAATKSWHYSEASAWHTSAMWMYLIAIFMVCGAAFLLVYNFWVIRKYKRNLVPEQAGLALHPRPPHGYETESAFEDRQFPPSSDYPPP